MKKLMCLITAFAFALGSVAPAFSQGAGSDAVYEIKEVIAAKNNYEYIRSLMVMMNENRPLDEIAKVVYEVEQYTLIADDLLEVAKIFYEEGEELKQMRRIAAKTHLLLVSFYLYQKNYTGATEHFRLAEEIYPELDTDLELEIEVAAERDRMERYVVRYEMNDVQKFRSKFQGSVGRSVEFEVEVDERIDPTTLSGVTLKSNNVLVPDSPSFRLLELANRRIEEQLAAGERFFRLTLAPGDYQLTQDAATIFPQRFTIPSDELEQEQFSLFIQPDEWFTLEFADIRKNNPPELYYYGIKISEEDMNRLPFGEYEVRADPKDYTFEYGKIYFEPSSSGEDATYGADIVEIYLPPQSKYILDLGKKGVFSRIGDTSVD